MQRVVILLCYLPMGSISQLIEKQSMGLTLRVHGFSYLVKMDTQISVVTLIVRQMGDGIETTDVQVMILNLHHFMH